MPNQTDPNQNPQPVSPSAIPPVQPGPSEVPPVLPVSAQNTDIPPLPDFMSAESAPLSSSAPPATGNAMGSAAPSNLPPVVSTPKKKFGGGKIIATILGLFLLIGGIGAGILLTQQSQDVREKAYSGQVGQRDICNLVGYGVQENINCPLLTGNTGTNNVSNYQATYYLRNLSSSSIVVKYKSYSCYCPTAPYGNGSSGGNPYACNDNCKLNESEITIEAGKTESVAVSRASDSGESCGSYQTDFYIVSINGNADCHSAGTDNGHGYISMYTGCQTGTTCSIASPTPSPTPSPTGTPGCNTSCTTNANCPTGYSCWAEEPGDPKVCRKTACQWQGSCVCATTPPTATPTPLTTGVCSGIKAYKENWTEYTPSELRALQIGNTVRFCAAGVASSGNFDKARFTINGVAQAETTLKRPGSNDFCSFYSLGPAGENSFNIRAKLHHPTLGWVE